MVVRDIFLTSTYQLKPELTTTVSLPECMNFLLYFNFKYVNLSSFLVWYNYSFHKLTPEEKAKLQKKIVHLPPIPMHEFEKELQLLDPKYPLKIPPSAILTFQVVVGFVVILTIVIMVWLCLRHHGHLSTLLKFAPEVPKVLKGDFTSIGKLLHPATPRPTSATTLPTAAISMPNLTCTPEAPPLPPKQREAMVPENEPTTPGLHSTTAETLEPKIVKQAIEQLHTEGQLSLKLYRQYLHKHMNVETSPV